LGTFLEIKDRVEGAIIDLPTHVETSIPRLVNFAYRDLQRKHNFWIMRATQAYTTVLETRSLGSTPTDFKEFRDKPYFLMDDDGRVKTIETSPHALSSYGAIMDDDTGFPMLIQRSDPTAITGTSNMLVFPLPDGLSDYSDGEYRVTVPYWKYLPELTVDGDTNWLTEEGEEYIFYRAVAQGFGLDWDEVHEAVWLQKAALELQELIKADRRQKLSGVDTLVPHWRGVNSPKVRW
jgi:hypothetical protein